MGDFNNSGFSASNLGWQDLYGMQLGNGGTGNITFGNGTGGNSFLNSTSGVNSLFAVPNTTNNGGLLSVQSTIPQSSNLGSSSALGTYLPNLGGTANDYSTIKIGSNANANNTAGNTGNGTKLGLNAETLGLGLQALSAGMGLYNIFSGAQQRQLDMLEDYYDYQKALASANYANSAKAYNNQIDASLTAGAYIQGKENADGTISNTDATTASNYINAGQNKKVPTSL